MPMRGELPPVSTRAYTQRPSVLAKLWPRIVAVLGNGDLQAVVLFCAIGLLLTFNLVTRFPDFGAQAAALSVFP